MLLSDYRLVALQGADGIAVVPAEDIALVMPEASAPGRVPLPPPLAGRMTVVLGDGRVLHRPPCDWPAPLIEGSDGVFLNPSHARRSGKLLRFPGGWTLPGPAPKVPRLDRQVSDVIWMKGDVCATVAGQERIGKKAAREIAARPELVEVGPWHVNVERLRGVHSGDRDVVLDLAPDQRVAVPKQAGKALGVALGLDDLSWITPLSDAHRAMTRLGLRDFPFVLLEAPAAALKAAFGDDMRTAVANLAWEAFRRRGQLLGYGTEYRGFWYRPVLPVITRMGLRREIVSPLNALELLSFDDPQYLLYGRVITQMVGDDRLLTFRDLGFSDPHPQLRTVGTRRPDWLVAAEKSSLLAFTRHLGEMFGVSTIVLGGQPRYEIVEFLADALRPKLGGRPLNVVSYGDYDDAGWTIADALLAQLTRYGIEARLAGRLVRPERFTREEIRLFAEPIPAEGKSRQTQVKAWVKRSGGIGGKARGLHADHLTPVERVVKAFHEETGLRP